VICHEISGTIAQTWVGRLGNQIRDLPPIEQVVMELKREVRQVMR